MQSGIISLVSDFSIQCIIESGRVSLAHLIEFSHFVDLYVLEDDIYVDSGAKNITLRYFNEDQDCPIKSLLEDHLADSVFEVSRETLRIYDAAPINHTFSLGSYEYWLKLSAEDRQNISTIVGYKTPGKNDRDDLLAISRRLDLSITETIEQVALTNYSLMPSSRNLMPFMHSFRQMDTPAFLLYREASASHRKQIEDVLTLIKPKMIYLPPLLSILLSRCNSPSDIPYRLMKRARN